VSQRRRRPTARPAQKRRATSTTNRSQRIYAILGVVVVVALIAAVVGPPLVDFLTQPDDDVTVDLNDDSSDPVVADYQTQIAADPNDAETMAALGSYLGNTGQVDAAIPWYEKALSIAPENWDIRLGFARALANGDKRADAELQFKKVLAARPEDEQAHFSLAQLYMNWVPARTDEAIAEYQLVIKYGGDSFVVERAAEELAALGVASPVAATPVASPVGTPTEVSQ
jgi:cytochrome c-type biogenesis protein CcmH/NrfG